MNKEEAQKLLPWFAVGALDEDEARAVSAHLEGSPELQRELDELRVLEREVIRVTEDEPEFRPAAIEGAWRQIDAYERTREAADKAPAKPGLIENAVEWLRETLVTGWMRSPSGARVAMVAQFALILVLGGIVFMPAGQDAGDAEFQTLSGSAATAPAGASLTVMFQPTVTEARIRETLADVGGEIVAGPSPQGNYTIRVDSTDAAGVELVLGQLRGQPDVVRFATELE